MEDHKALRNLLDEILDSGEDEDVPGLEELSMLIYRRLPHGHAALDAPHDAASQSPPEGQEERDSTGRIKATHYLYETTLEDLAIARAKLAAMLSKRTGQHPSRSDIVDEALQIVLDEFAEKGMDSTLVRRIIAFTKKTA